MMASVGPLDFTYEVSLARAEIACVRTPILQPSKGILVLRHAQPLTLIGGSGLSGRWYRSRWRPPMLDIDTYFRDGHPIN